MKKILVTFLLTALYSASGAQTLVISSRIYREDADCATENSPKTIRIELLMGEKYNQVSKVQPVTCTNYYKVPRFFGKFRAFIDAAGYQTHTLNFEITKAVKDTLDLGVIVLKKIKVTTLESVTVTGIKKEYIKIEADKTTFGIKNNELLSGGSTYDAIVKLPGVLQSPTGEVSVNGKIAVVYIDGIQSNLSGQDLRSFLLSLPANAVEKIEVVSNPDASYSANASGAVINIITQGRGIKGLRGTLSLNYGFNRYQKAQPSLILNGKTGILSWQLNMGYNYIEEENNNILTKTFTYFNPVRNFTQQNFSQRINRFSYVRPSFNLKTGKNSSLLFNYNYSRSNNADATTGNLAGGNVFPAFSLINDLHTENRRDNHELITRYSKKLNKKGAALDITGYYAAFEKNQFLTSRQLEGAVKRYGINNLALDLENAYIKADISLALPDDVSLKAGAKAGIISAGSSGRYNTNSATDSIFTEPSYVSGILFDYTEQNTAAYIDLRKKIKKITLGGGIRLEDFRIRGVSSNLPTVRNNFTSLFPSGNILYELSTAVNLSASYARKVAIPGYGDLDPNNAGYFDQYNNTVGNPFLRPTFINNYEFKTTVFNYLQFVTSYSASRNVNLLVFDVPDNSINASQTFRSFDKLRNFSVYTAVPVPFGFIKKGMKFFKEGNLNIDKMNYVYLFASYNSFRVISANEFELPNKPIWAFGAISQIVLPADWRIGLQYAYFSKGTYQIYQVQKPVQNTEFTVSKSIFKKALKITASVSDAFNMNEVNAFSRFRNLDIGYFQKPDTRVFRLRLSYTFGRFKNLKKETAEIESEGKKVESDRKIGPN